MILGELCLACPVEATGTAGVARLTVRGASESEHEALWREYVGETGSGEIDVEVRGEPAGDKTRLGGSWSSSSGAGLSVAGAGAGAGSQWRPARKAGACSCASRGNGVGRAGEVDEVAEEDAAYRVVPEYGLHPFPELGRDLAGAVGEVRVRRRQSASAAD